MAPTGSSTCSMTSARTTTSKPASSSKSSSATSCTSRPSTSRAWSAASRESSTPRVVPGCPRLVEQQPGPAADVEEPSRGHVLGDELEEAVRGRATPASSVRYEPSRVSRYSACSSSPDGSAGCSTEPHSWQIREIPVQAELVARGARTRPPRRESPAPDRRSRSSPEQTRQLSPAGIRRGTVSVGGARNDRVDQVGGVVVEGPGPPALRGDDVPRRAHAAGDVAARGPSEAVQERRGRGSGASICSGVRGCGWPGHHPATSLTCTT